MLIRLRKCYISYNNHIFLTAKETKDFTYKSLKLNAKACNFF